MSAAIAATGDFIPACITVDRFIDTPPGTAGIVGSAGAVGTAGMTGVGVEGTGMAGVATGGGVTDALGIEFEGVSAAGAGILAGALGIGRYDGAAVGGALGGVTGTGITGLGGVTEFIGNVRGGSELRSIGGRNALPRWGSIVLPRGGSPVERSGTNFGPPTLALPGAESVRGDAPSKTDEDGEKIRGLVFAFAFVAGPDSNTDVGAENAGAVFIAGGVLALVTGVGGCICGAVAGFVVVIGRAGEVGVGIAGGSSLPKRRLSSPGFFRGSSIGSGMGVGAATMLGRAGAVLGFMAEFGVTGRAGGSAVVFVPIALGVAGIAAAGLAGAEVVAALPGFPVGFAAGFASSGGMWLLSMSVKTSPDFMSLTSDWYEPSAWRSVLTILTFFSAPFSNLSVMTSPTLGGAAGASLPAPSASPTAAVIPNTPVQAHRFQIHRFMADSVQHALPAPPMAAGRHSMPAQ